MSSESKDEDTLHTSKCDGTFKIRSVTKLGDGEEEGLVDFKLCKYYRKIPITTYTTYKPNILTEYNI